MRTPPSDREETQFHQVGEYFHVEWQGVLATCFQERVKFTFQPVCVFNFPSGLFLAIIVLGSTEEFVAYRWHDTFLLGRGLQPSWSWSESALSLAHKTKRTSRPFWKQPKHQTSHTKQRETTMSIVNKAMLSRSRKRRKKASLQKRNSYKTWIITARKLESFFANIWCITIVNSNYTVHFPQILLQLPSCVSLLSSLASQLARKRRKVRWLASILALLTHASESTRMEKLA